MIRRFLIKITPKWFWVVLIKSDPNWCDYFRGASWSIAVSNAVTIALKLESWSGVPICLLILSFVIFSISASFWTLLSNSIKKYQSEFSDRKLIERTQNGFKDEGNNNDNLVHVYEEKNIVDYPNFITLGQFIQNKESGNAATKNNVKGVNSLMAFCAASTLILGLFMLGLAAMSAMKNDNKTKEYYDSTFKLDKLLRQQDSLNRIYKFENEKIFRQFDLLKDSIDSLKMRLPKVN